jgi:hypothetical protein
VTGKVYAQREPGVLVRLHGQAPLAATVYTLAKLRCNLCGEIVTAGPPPGVGPEKYDATSASMIALLKYGSGVPFHRLERLQATVEIPAAGVHAMGDRGDHGARTPAGDGRVDSPGRAGRRAAQR